MARTFSHVVVPGGTRRDVQGYEDEASVLDVRDDSDLADVVNTAMRGAVVVLTPESGPLLDAVVGDLRRLGHVTILRPGDPSTHHSTLDEGARQLLGLLADGLTLGQAAERLHVSRRTADRRLAEARRMLGATSTAQAVAAFLGGRRYPQGRALRQPLVGRDADVATAVEDLRHDRALLVVGYGGIGKSALLDTVVGADGRPTRSAAALASMGWREYWPLSAALGGMSLTGDVEAVAAIVEAEVGPDVLVVDDLHLADRSTIEVLAALAGRVALAGACRPDEGNGPAAVERLREAGLDVLVLTPLDSSSAAVLTRSLAPDLPPARVEAIVAGAAGLPLLVEFLSGIDPDAPVGRGLVPSVDALSEASLSVAVLLAVAGQPIAIDGTDLMAAGIAVRDQDGRVRIRHQLVAEAVLGRASAEQRADAHRRLAERAGDPGQAAQHWLAAGETARAHDRALAAAESMTSLADRARMLDLAARCDDAHTREQATLTAARALADAGLHAEAAATLDRYPWDDSAPVARAEAQLVRARAAWHAGDSPSAIEHAHAGLALTAGTGTLLEAQLLVESVRCEVLSVGITDQHDAMLARAALIVGDGPGRAALLNVAAILPYFRTGEGIVEWQAGLEAAIAEGDVDTRMRCANNVIMWNEASGDQEAALEMAVAMGVEAAQSGLGAWELQFAAAAANLMYHAGRYPEALPLLERVLAEAIDERTREQARVVHASILIDLGMIDAARAQLPPLPDAGSQDWLHDNSLFSVYAALELAAGRPRAVLAIADQFAERAQTDSSTWKFLMPIRAWAQHDLGLRVDGSADESPIPLVQGLIRETQGVALLSTDARSAVEVLDDAAAIGRQWSRAQGLRAQWGAAEAARTAGADDVVERLLAVEAVAESMGLEPLLARVHRSLRLAGVARAARRSPDRTGLLTERERLVLDLLSEGSTYTEIARRLGVGRPTVRRLGQNAQLKLGVDSRLAAVVAAAQH